MNAIRAARHHLNLTQSAFGVYLALKVGINQPMNQSRISAYESGTKRPSKAIMEVIAPLAAKFILIKVGQSLSRDDYAEATEFIQGVIV